MADTHLGFEPKPKFSTTTMASSTLASSRDICESVATEDTDAFPQTNVSLNGTRNHVMFDEAQNSPSARQKAVEKSKNETNHSMTSTDREAVPASNSEARIQNAEEESKEAKVPDQNGAAQVNADESEYGGSDNSSSKFGSSDNSSNCPSELELVTAL